MKLEINLPFCMWDFKIVGIYKITFDDGSFYIGGSNNMKGRASAWESCMDKNHEKNIGFKVKEKITQLTSAIFDIIELCHEKDLRDKESFYLDKYKDDVKMISSNDNGAWKAILQYKIDGVFIKKHYSISSAARYNNVNLSGIQRVLSGERNSCKGMVFIYDHDYHMRRQSIVKRRYRKVERKNGRDVLMLNSSGEIINRFRQIKEAAKEIGCNPTGIARSLSGFQKTAMGYSFKYAE